MVRPIFKLDREHPIPEATPRITGYREILIVPDNWAEPTCRQLDCRPVGSHLVGYQTLERNQTAVGELDTDTRESLYQEAQIAGKSLFCVQRDGTLSASVEEYEDGTRGYIHLSFSFSKKGAIA
jgi:hypothetical protein